MTIESEHTYCPACGLVQTGAKCYANKCALTAPTEPTGAQADESLRERAMELIAYLNSADMPYGGGTVHLLLANLTVCQRDLEAARASEDAAIKSDTIAHEQIQELRAQLASAAKDAARYRTLRDSGEFSVYIIDSGADGTGIEEREISAGDLDSAIDDAALTSDAAANKERE